MHNNNITDKEEAFYQNFIYGPSHLPPQRQLPTSLLHNVSGNNNEKNGKQNHNYVSNVNNSLLTNNNTPSFS